MIKGFVITPQNVSSFVAKVMHLDPTRQWVANVVERKSKRSLDQNDWVRKYARDASSYFGYEPDEMYDILMYKHNPVFVTDKETLEVIRLAGHFSKLDTKVAAEVQESILRWGEQLGFIWDKNETS